MTFVYFFFHHFQKTFLLNFFTLWGSKELKLFVKANTISTVKFPEHGFETFSLVILVYLKD